MGDISILIRNMENKKYLHIVAHYEACLAKYGDTHLGVDWPCQRDAAVRYQVMLDVIKPFANTRVSLLDFGCGASHLFDFILQNKLSHIDYSGLDLSEKYIELSWQKYPSVKYYCMDILDSSDHLPEFDYIVMNGVFTEKIDLVFDEMYSYFTRLIIRIFSNVKIGLAFNVMSSHVDLERVDLFHLPFDLLADFLSRELTRNFVFRNDYGLYEYTTYVYK